MSVAPLVARRAYGGLKGAVRSGLARLSRRQRRALFDAIRGFHLPTAVTRHLPVEGPFRVDVGRGAGFTLHGHGLPAESHLYWNGLAGHEERESLRLWARLCRRASVIVDVGAYIGVYALTASAANPGATVFGFEPLGSAFEIFAANCVENSGRVRAVRAAVGDRDGTAELYVGDAFDVASLGRPEGRSAEHVPIRSLRTFLAEEGLDRVDLLKVDVETFEPAVVAGLGDLLERSRPSMIVEVLSNDVGSVLERLCPGYEYFHIDEKKGLVRRARVERVSHESRNYLFCPRDAAAPPRTR